MNEASDRINIATRDSRRSLIEAILFVSGEPVTVPAILKATNLAEGEVIQLLADLAEEYRSRNGGILISEAGGAYRMVTNPAFGHWLKRFTAVQTSGRLSQASLETLTIIAYKQPLTKIEIDRIRGVGSDGSIKSLLDRRLIRILGKKEVPGRPFLYGTSREFLLHFGLKSLSDLPPVEQANCIEAA